MKTRPMVLKLLSFFFAMLAVGLPFQIMMLYGHTPFEPVEIAAKLSPLNWAICFLAPLAAALVYNASPLCVAVIPALSYVVLKNNWLVAEVGTDYSPLIAGMGSGAYLATVSMLCTARIRDLLLNPERRWWFTPFRKRVNVPVVVGNEGTEFAASTFDISETGAFIRGWSAQAAAPGSQLQNLKPGKIIYLMLDLKNSKRVECRAQVVRQVGAQGTYPEGIGVRFIDMQETEREAIKEFTRSNTAANSESLAA